MSLLSLWKQGIADEIGKAIGQPVQVEEIGVPPQSEQGDFTMGCFRIAKQTGKNPAVLAQEIASGLKRSEWIETASAIGPYVNIRIPAFHFVERVVQSVQEQGVSFGKGTKRDEPSLLFEYANPNTHKEIHIGHLRMFITGAVLVNIWHAAGKNVTPIRFVNDQGVNVAKTLWAMAHAAHRPIKTVTVEDVSSILASIPVAEQTGRTLGRFYTDASRIVADESPEAAEVAWIQAKLEAHDPAWEALWKATRDWCLRELDEIGAELGVQTERLYLESDLIDRAQEVVHELEAKKVAKISEGALIVDLEAEKLGVFLIRKSNGNLLYASKDLALAEAKLADYPQMGRSLVLVDKRQSLYFKQLESVLKKMGYPVPYGAMTFEIVTLKEGAMSSRKGNIVTYQELREAVVGYATSQVKQRHSEWTDQQVADAARSLAFSGIKFALLKSGLDRVFTFDMEEALAFDGATGPYCQYAAVRLQSILQKGAAAGLKPVLSAQGEQETLPAELFVAKQIASLADTIQRAAQEQQPSFIAQWCLDLAQAINAFYRDVPVLDAKTVEEKETRLALAAAARQAMANGLTLLGISLPEAM